MIKDGLYQLFFQMHVVSLDENTSAVAVFVIACGIVGALAVILDLAFYSVKDTSLLELNHSIKNTLIFLLAWSFGACVIGLVGQMFNIFQISLAATVVVGFTWPVLFTGLLEKLKEQEQKLEPEQTTTSED